MDDQLHEAPDVTDLDGPRSGSARRIALGVGAVLAGLVLVLGLAVATRGDDDGTASGLLGQRVPAIAGDDVLSGAPFDIDQTRGQWVVVNFFGTWCPGCLVEHPELVSFEQWAEPRGVEMVSVVVNDPPERAAEFFRNEGGTWNVVMDQRTSIDFGVAQLPETFLISPDGTVVAHWTGSITEANLRAELPG